MHDDLTPEDFMDPFDRLKLMEHNQDEMGEALESACDQIRLHSKHFVDVSQAFMQMVKTVETLKIENRSLHQQAQNLHHRITILERKAQEDDNTSTT